MVARVSRRHRHPVDVVGAERVGGDAGDDRRVDPAGQPDHDVGEPVLRAVVAGPEHEGVVQLTVVVERWRDRCRRSGLALDDRRRRHVRRSAAVPWSPGRAGRAAACGTRAGSGRRRSSAPRRTAGRARSSVPSASNTSDAPSNTSSSCPPTWLTYTTRAVRIGGPRRQHPLAPGALADRWYGEALMLMFSSAPPAACSASGPNGLQMSSQIEIPTFTPPITYSSSGS